MKEEKKPPQTQKKIEVLKADLERSDTFILKKIEAQWIRNISEEFRRINFKNPTGTWDWTGMERIEDPFPTWKVQAEMTRCVGEEGGAISSAVFQGQNNSNYTATTVWVTHPLCAHTSSYLMRWGFTMMFQMDTKWRTAITVKFQVARKTLIAHKHGLCLHFTTLHKAP